MLRQATRCRQAFAFNFRKKMACVCVSVSICTIVQCLRTDPGHMINTNYRHRNARDAQYRKKYQERRKAYCVVFQADITKEHNKINRFKKIKYPCF